MTKGHDHEHWEDTAATYVLGALPDGERAGYEAHLRGCPACAAEVDELRVAAEALPVSPPPMLPPPALKARIMAEVEREAALLQAASAPERKAPKRRLRFGGALAIPRPAFAALACALLAAGVLMGSLLFDGAGQRTVPFRSTLPQASAELEVTDDGAIIVADRLPPPPAGRVYMAWTVRPGEAPEPTSALFTPRGDGSATASLTGDLDGVESVLINTEPIGGSQQPTSQPVLTATLS